MTKHMRDSSICREKAKAILASVGRAEDWDPLDDYYLATTADGEEVLTVWGLDEPLALNRTTTSWLSPGWPPATGW